MNNIKNLSNISVVIITLYCYSTMHRDIPVFNRPVMDKIYRRNQEKHQQRLRNIKSNINSASSTSYSLCNRKALLHQERKKTQIQRQNVELFNKMMRIMKRNDPNNKPRMSFSSQKPRTSAQYSRITQENRHLFERLQQQKPTISNKKLMVQRMKNVNILRFLGKYPNRGAANSYYDKFEKKSLNQNQQQEIGHCEDCGGHYQLDSEQRQRPQTKQTQIRNQQNQNSMNARKRLQSQNVNRTQAIFSNKPFEQQLEQEQFPTTKFSSQKFVNIPVQNNSNKNQNSITLFTDKIVIQGNKMRVFVIRHYNQYQIKATSTDSSKPIKSYSVHIPEEQGNQFFVFYDYNYKKIVKMLALEDGQLVIDNSKQQIYQNKQQNMQQKLQDKVIVEEKNPLIIGKEWGQYQQALEEFVQ